MQTQGVVLTLAVQDVDRALAFYRDGLGIESAAEVAGVVSIELPGMTVFLASGEDFAVYARAAASAPRLPEAAVNAIIHVAIATAEEVDALLIAAPLAGGESFEPITVENAMGRRQHIGSVKDPDGHLWQLVANLE